VIEGTRRMPQSAKVVGRMEKVALKVSCRKFGKENRTAKRCVRWRSLAMSRLREIQEKRGGNPAELKLGEKYV